ncbi:MAG: hypothetical protein AAFN74_05670, partial [Myxococcota bacterium]
MAQRVKAPVITTGGQDRSSAPLSSAHASALSAKTRLRVFISQQGAIYFFAIAAAIGPRTAAAGESAHTSEAPQSLPAKPYNLYSLLTHDDLVAEIEQRHDPSNWPVHLERVT